MEVLFLVFWGTPILISIVETLIYILVSNVKGFLFTLCHHHHFFLLFVFIMIAKKYIVLKSNGSYTWRVSVILVLNKMIPIHDVIQSFTTMINRYIILRVQKVFQGYSNSETKLFWYPVFDIWIYFNTDVPQFMMGLHPEKANVSWKHC
jgi:hypothetical protein